METVNVLLLGSEGNMGKRYQAILRKLRISFTGVDKNDIRPKDKFSHVIIATPTDTHYDLIKEYKQYSVPILCEKPITTNPNELEQIMIWKAKLTMVNQYAHMQMFRASGSSCYDYFKTGDDGLGWDCINILGMAKGKVTLMNKSPIWQCQLNGQTLRINDMDEAYISMIMQWCWSDYSWGDIDYIINAHQKVLKWQKS